MYDHMLKITPERLLEYSKCPKKASFSWNNERKKSTEEKIISGIIKTAHVYHARKERAVPWKHFTGWLDRHIRVSILKDLDPQSKYKEAKNILIRVSDWYNKYYCNYYCDPGMSNVPVMFALDQHMMFSDSIDLVTVGDKVRLFEIAEPDQNTSAISLYNSVKVQSRIWGFYQVTKTKPDEYVKLLINKRTMARAVISISDKQIEKTNKVVDHFVSGIRKDLFYPSISEQCVSCDFRSICSF